MRVLYLAPSGRQPGQLSRRSFLDEEIRALADGGVEAYVLCEAASQDEDAGRIHVRAMPPNGPSELRGTAGFVARHRRNIPLANLQDPIRFYRAVRIERRASEVIKSERIDVIHSFFGWPSGFGGLLAKADTGTPLLAALRGSDVNVLPRAQYGLRLDPSFDRAFRRLLKAADVTASVSAFVRRQAIALGAPPNRSCVVPKGVRLDQFGIPINRDEVRARLGVGPRHVVLAVSGLLKMKGLDTVLAALAMLRSSHDFSLVICGHGPELESLRSTALQLGIGDRTTFCGAVSRSRIADYFVSADVFVHGSLMEASGNVLLEAMASRVPIVCTDAGGPREYVEDGVTGFVVPVGDPQAIAEKVRLLLDDVLLREAFGKRGRQRTEQLFSYERMIDDTLAMYRQLSRGGRGDRGHVNEGRTYITA